MADARPSIPITPIRIDARIIVFLYSGPAVPEPPAHRGSRPNDLSPDGYTREPSMIRFARPLGTRTRHLSCSIERIT